MFILYQFIKLYIKYNLYRKKQNTTIINNN